MNTTNDILYVTPDIADIAQLEKFFQRSLTENFSYFPLKAHEYYSRPWQPTALKQRIETQQGLLLTARIQNEIVGLVSGTPAEGGVGTIIWLMVAPHHQNKRIGAALLSEAKKYYRIHQAHKIKLTVHDEKAVNFYLREGFIREAEHHNHWWGMNFSAMAFFTEPKAS
jgi:ribosomal protein S18 acetylase RimI-like enzyme